MSKHIHLGKFKTPSGVVYISDPSYDPPKEKGSFEMNRLIKVPKKEWDVYITQSGDRNASIIMERKKTKKEYSETPKNSNKFSIGVDSGQAGFFDSKHYKNDKDTKNKPLADYIDINGEGDKWYAMVCNITIDTKLNAGILPFGAVSSSGYGDGEYEVIVNYYGKEVGSIEIIFILDKEEEEEDEENEIEIPKNKK